MSKIKICTVCGNKYEYCGHCDKDGIEKRWKTKYCSIDCRDVFDIISKYSHNHISKEEAKNELFGKNVNIKGGSGLEKFYKEIIGYNEPTPAPIEVEAPISVEEEEKTPAPINDPINDPINEEIPSPMGIEFKSKRRHRRIQKQKNE